MIMINKTEIKRLRFEMKWRNVWIRLHSYYSSDIMFTLLYLLWHMIIILKIKWTNTSHLELGHKIKINRMNQTTDEDYFLLKNKRHMWNKMTDWHFILDDSTKMFLVFRLYSQVPLNIYQHNSLSFDKCPFLILKHGSFSSLLDIRYCKLVFPKC